MVAVEYAFHQLKLKSEQMLRNLGPTISQYLLKRDIELFFITYPIESSTYLFMTFQRELIIPVLSNLILHASNEHSLYYTKLAFSKLTQEWLVVFADYSVYDLYHLLDLTCKVLKCFNRQKVDFSVTPLCSLVTKYDISNIPIPCQAKFLSVLKWIAKSYNLNSWVLRNKPDIISKPVTMNVFMGIEAAVASKFVRLTILHDLRWDTDFFTTTGIDIFHIFEEQDDKLIASLMDLLHVNIDLFADLVAHIRYDHLVVIDWICSSETSMLEYLVTYLRYVDVQNIILEQHVLDFLIRLRLSIERMKKIFPYNPTPLLNRLLEEEHRHDGFNIGTRKDDEVTSE